MTDQKLYNFSVLSLNASKDFQESKVIFDYDEDLWIYSELEIIDIVWEKTLNNKR
jgi:hypothetical protein